MSAMENDARIARLIDLVADVFEATVVRRFHVVEGRSILVVLEESDGCRQGNDRPRTCSMHATGCFGTTEAGLNHDDQN
jgi:hypothetical protein